MPLRLHYSGKFNPAASLPELIEVVKNVAATNGWSYSVYETEFPLGQLGLDTYNDKIYGISFIAPKSEPMFISFLSNGRMSTHDHLTFWGNNTEVADKQYLYLVSTKTHDAGPETHKIIVDLLRYLDTKYLHDLSVKDEGQYWETHNKELLHNNFHKIDETLRGFSVAVEHFPFLEGESMDAYIERMMKYLQSGEND